jgi:phenylpropionate dioxygenase-like ring-hydroxylating dioxygenase large terminal subunit
MPGHPRPPLPAGVLTLPAPYYADPAHFAREMERIHFSMWLCAGRSEELATAGRYVLREVADAGVILLRDEGGRLAAFHNVCRHRGTRLCTEKEGQLPARIQCGYHGWTYRLDGTLAAAPHMDHVAGFREADYPLRRVAIDEWDGHVFINVAESPPPLSDQLADLPGKFRPWRMEELRRVERKLYSVEANWKLLLQNYSECLHCPIVHPLLQKQSHYLSGENESPRPSPTYLGGRMDLRDGVETLSMDGTTSGRALPGLSPEDRRRVYYYAVLPNLLLNLHPDYVLTFTLWPRAVDRTEIVCEWHFHPDEIARPGFDPKGAVEFWDLTNGQDWQLSELAQQGIASRGYVPGPYSNREELLYALDRFVVERTGS